MADEGKSVAKIIDGKAIAKQIHGEVAEGVAKLKEATGKVPGLAVIIVGEHKDSQTYAKVKPYLAMDIPVPGLAVIIVGERKDSQTYVRMKVKACQEVGIASFEGKLPGDASQDDVIAAVREFNANPDLPLPAHISEEAVLAEVALPKDVDGFHPINIGQLAMKGRHPQFAPCTPEGCMVLLEHSGVQISGQIVRRLKSASPQNALPPTSPYSTPMHQRPLVPPALLQGCIVLLERSGVPISGQRVVVIGTFYPSSPCHIILKPPTPFILQGCMVLLECSGVQISGQRAVGCMVLLERSGVQISGQRAVVIGRSNIVGMPAAMLLVERDATVTIVHSRTKEPKEIVKQADIVIAAIGRAQMVKADWLKPGCAVIDVGINAVDDASNKAGYRLVGNVDYEQAREAHLPCSLSSHSTALLPAPLRPLSFNSPSPPPARSFSIASPTLSILHQVKADWLKPGCAVIDVGINAVDDVSKKAGYRLVGDVDYEGAREVAGWITPVPGGVGPMTIAVLLQHTLTAAQRALGANS
ncbi:unnamed protein product [Closterium sp. NIES-65]|nr:unnamed protein product [Closterium sp. NIES-65]